MTLQGLCAAFNHSWICLKDGYCCPVFGRFFPLGIGLKQKKKVCPIYWNSRQRLPVQEVFAIYRFLRQTISRASVKMTKYKIITIAPKNVGTYRAKLFS
jgi:hypothetical protein